MIVVQVAFVVVLLFGASVFCRSLRKLKTVHLGFGIEHVAGVDLSFRGKEPFAGSQALEYVLTRVPHLPGVESADLATPNLLSGASMTSDVKARGGSKTGGTRESENTYFAFVSPQHFATLQMPLLRGRDFSKLDRKGSAAVAIINQKLAAQLWPGEDAVGKQMTGGWEAKNPVVVGVVGNSKFTNVRQEYRPIVYEPLAQISQLSVGLEVRSRIPLAQLQHQVRRIVREAAPNFQVSNVLSMELLRDQVIMQDRVLTFLSILFGVLGTALAVVGTYGLIAYSVVRRTREIGIRMSVGAERRDVLLLFLRETGLLVSMGLAIGLPLALAAARPLGSFLSEVPATDPVSIAATLGLIAIGGAAAALLPARRATRVEPMEALRYA